MLSTGPSTEVVEITDPVREAVRKAGIGAACWCTVLCRTPRRPIT